MSRLELILFDQLIKKNGSFMHGEIEMAMIKCTYYKLLKAIYTIHNNFDYTLRR